MSTPIERYEALDGRYKSLHKVYRAIEDAMVDEDTPLDDRMNTQSKINSIRLKTILCSALLTDINASDFASHDFNTEECPDGWDKVKSMFELMEEKIDEVFPVLEDNWNLDDKFGGITVLYSDPEPVLDIVAVHGLGGNAFDTFARDSHRTWLRDFLPVDPQINKIRTMTFGYSSSPKDSGNNEGVREWASALLGGVASVRESQMVVQADSASLNAVAAQPIADVNHRQICKFEHKDFEPYHMKNN
ncbi:hypothetical protein F4677DRAFT_464700 [Hypoxylon crocopeplum]|nr:hypothetical protein F4677DRAFT_464700 [Hypoxylon crocopeplum]